MKTSRSPIFILFTGLLFLLAACGGGGGGGSDDDDDNGGGSVSTLNPLNLDLKAGEFWEFVWNASNISFAQGSGSTGGSSASTFRITLGAPLSIDGQQAFPLIITGDPGDFTPRWTHVAIDDDGSLLGSTNGLSMTKVYDAETDEWVGGGFFVSFAANEAVNLESGSFAGEYNTVDALTAGHSSSDGGCETILGNTICSDTSTNFSENEFYKEGIGPVGYELSASFTSSGGGFFTSTQRSELIELTATSFTASDSTVFNPPPWEEVESLNTPRSGHKAVVLDGKIYVLGGAGANPPTVEIYDPVQNIWTNGQSLPSLPITSWSAEVLNGKIYVDDSTNDQVFEFDPNIGWSTVPVPPGGGFNGSFGFSSSTYVDATFGDIILGATSKTSLSGTPINVRGFDPSPATWLTGVTGLGVTELLRHSVEIIGDTLYVFGGFGQSNSLDDRGAQEKLFGYNILTDGWSFTLASMVSARDTLGSAVLDDKIYAMGGNPVTCGLLNCNTPNIGPPFRSVEIYDPTANTWTSGTSMFQARTEFSAVTLNGKIYAIGGSDGNNTLGKVERFTPP